jgi:hypothetical protein
MADQETHPEDSYLNAAHTDDEPTDTFTGTGSRSITFAVVADDAPQTIANLALALGHHRIAFNLSADVITAIQLVFSASDGSNLLSDESVDSHVNVHTSDNYFQVFDPEDYIRRSAVDFTEDGHAAPRQEAPPAPAPPDAAAHAPAPPEDTIRPEDSASNLTTRLTRPELRLMDFRILQHCIEALPAISRYPGYEDLRLSHFVNTFDRIHSIDDLLAARRATFTGNIYTSDAAVRGIFGHETDHFRHRGNRNYHSHFYNAPHPPDASTEYEALHRSNGISLPAMTFTIIGELTHFASVHNDTELTLLLSQQRHQCHLSQVCPFNWLADVPRPISVGSDSNFFAWLSNRATQAVYDLELPTKYFSSYAMLSRSFTMIETHRLFADALSQGTSPP